jgi:Fur family transcriptional regulator, peroxide stress response regulator
MIMIIITDMPKARWTKQLKVIVDIVYGSDGPITAEHVYWKAKERLPNVSLGTVYRNLNKLVLEGLISESRIGTSATFVRHPFSNAQFECTVCHKLFSVPYELNLLDLSRRTGMNVERWELHLRGVCTECEPKCT